MDLQTSIFQQLIIFDLVLFDHSALFFTGHPLLDLHYIGM